MGLMDKIKFWKKHDDLGLGDTLPQDTSTDMVDQLGLEPVKDDILGNPIGQEGTVDKPLSLNEKSNFEEVGQSPQPGLQQSSNDFELISSKLDTIKSELDSINQRVQRIEKLTEASAEKNKKKSVW
ncbi:hypothetical protein HQ533_04595 [Candidatus Woesearchaeota archaeon]|nr:hypothetical protein [Candidatus Woesearchaeota archaeon]